MGLLMNVFGVTAQRPQAPVWCDMELTQDASGIAAGMRVATALGWRPVEAVAVGDPILTFDHGMQPVTGVTRQILWAGDSMDRCDWPLLVPVGALGNIAPMLILPGQLVMIESDLAEAIYGEPFAVIPAAALDGFRGIQRHRAQGKVEVVNLSFDAPQLVFANCGALFLCDAGADLIETCFAASDVYASLTEAEARALLVDMDWDDVSSSAPRAVSYGTR